MRLKRTGILTKIVIAVIAVYAVVSLVWVNGRYAKAREELEAKEQYKAELTARRDELQYEIDNSDDPQVLEKIARRDGNYVYPGEDFIG